MRKKYIWPVVGLVILLITVGVFSLLTNARTKTSNDKIYVAAEDSGTVDVIDAKLNAVIKKIDLTNKDAEDGVMYMAHNVQVAPNGKTVWVTANAMSHHSASLIDKVWNSMFPTAYADAGHDSDPVATDQLIVIDPLKDEIVKRIDIGSGLHLAHVVVTPDSKFALTVSENKGEVYKVDAEDFTIVKTVKTPTDGKPHGFRVSPDGAYAYIALMGNNSIGKLNLSTFTFENIPLNGTPVQTGVSPAGKYVAASVFTSKSVAILDPSNGSLRYATLPSDAKGPLQLYPSPDSRYMYVADQGNDFGQPAGNKLYKVDLQQAKTVQTVQVGTAPHGVVLSSDGKYTYVTNMESDDVSVVDNAANKEIARIPVGQKSNGISYWKNQ